MKKNACLFALDGPLTSYLPILPSLLFPAVTSMPTAAYRENDIQTACYDTELHHISELYKGKCLDSWPGILTLVASLLDLLYFLALSLTGFLRPKVTEIVEVSSNFTSRFFELALMTSWKDKHHETKHNLFSNFEYFVGPETTFKNLMAYSPTPRATNTFTE